MTPTPSTVAERDGVDAAVRLLIGKPLCFIGRAASLLWVHFGDVRTIVSEYSGPKQVGEYALHTEARWLLLGPEGPVTGDADPACDQHLADLSPLLDQRALVVTATTADDRGRLRLELTGGYRLEVAPSGHPDSEHWRLFQPGVDAPHLVMTSDGIAGEN